MHLSGPPPSTLVRSCARSRGASATAEGSRLLRNADAAKKYLVRLGGTTRLCFDFKAYLPDAKGPRWCMDLSCIAGTAAA